MAKSFFIIFILCYISITISYNFNDEILDNIDDKESEAILNNNTDFSLSSSSTDYCIPVRAVKEIGCILSRRTTLFNGLFQTVCEQHQICYACGFAHGIPARQCNRLALMNIQRFSAITLLRQHVYQSVDTSREFFLECQEQCVFDYLYT